MRHLVDHRKLGRTASHRNALMRNMATSLILAERIETTLPKAKELRRLADRLITRAKEGTLHARRQVLAVVRDKDAVRKLFTVLADRFKERNGGYTRILKFGLRRGDSASMAAIEYLGYELPVKEKTPEKGKPEKAKPVKAKPEKAKPEKKAAAPKAKAAEPKAKKGRLSSLFSRGKKTKD